MNEEERTNEVGLFNYAVSYFRAAQALNESNLKTTHRDDPVCFLYYHAIELFLKSYLKLQGETLQDLKNLGHNSMALGNRCIDCGLGFDDEDIVVLELIPNDFLRSRYIETGYFQRATIEALDRTANSILMGVRQALKSEGRSVR